MGLEDRRLEKVAHTRDKVAASWHDLYSQLAAGSVFTADTPPLTSYALGDFKPKLVLERLLDPRPSYFAHKDILFAGLCAWTVAPKHKFLIDEAMVLAGAARLAAVERKHQEQFPQAPMLADIMTRVTGPGIDFYQDFYYAAGGLGRIIKARSPRLMQRSLRAASDGVGFAVEMMRVCHDHAARLQDRKYYLKASYISGGQAVSDLIKANKLNHGIINPLLAANLSKPTINGLNCKKRSDRFSRSVALVYAAFTVSYEGETLLSVLCKGEANYRRHGHLLPEWVGRAAYIAEHVISAMYVRRGMAEQTEYLTEIDPIQISPPSYGEASSCVDAAFKIGRKNSATVRK